MKSNDVPIKLKASQVKEWYRVLVTGDRKWRIDELAIKVVRSLAARHPGLIIVHGNESPMGVFGSFLVACRIEGVPCDLRGSNEEAVKSGANLCLAFHKFIPKSNGTKDCVDRCHRAGIPVWITNKEDARPVKLEPGQFSVCKGPAL